MALLQEALANKQAFHPNQPLRAPMPSHWTDMPQDVQVAYVELPLPPGCSPDPSAPADQPTTPPLDEDILQAMMTQVLGPLHTFHGVDHIHTSICEQIQSVSSLILQKVRQVWGLQVACMFTVYMMY